MDDMKAVTDPLRDFYRQARLSQFTQKEALYLTAKFLETMIRVNSEKQEPGA